MSRMSSSWYDDDPPSAPDRRAWRPRPDDPTEPMAVPPTAPWVPPTAPHTPAAGPRYVDPSAPIGAPTTSHRSATPGGPPHRPATYGNPPYGHAPYGHAPYGNPPYGAPPAFPPIPPSYPPAGGPPYGWPPAAPHPGAPSGRPPRSNAGVLVAVVIVLALLVGAAFIGAGSNLLGSDRSAETSQRRSVPLVPSTPSAPNSGNGSSGGSSSGGAATSVEWSEVAAKVSPGVVSILSDLPQGTGSGTGMVIDPSGRVLTNNHVVEGSRALVVTVWTTGERYDASVIGTVPGEDVAVLQMDGASELTTVPIGNSDGVEIGHQVAALGYSGGHSGEPGVEPGEVTDLGVQITASEQDGTNRETLQNMIQVDANVQPGDSGGALIDAQGTVVGMDTAASVSRSRRTTGGQGYAIPINHALEVARRIEAGGGSDEEEPPSSGAEKAANRGYLGVQVQTHSSGGAAVIGVQSGSPAERAGLVTGDVIVGVGTTTIRTATDLTTVLQANEAGTSVSVTWRSTDGSSYRSSIKLGEI